MKAAKAKPAKKRFSVGPATSWLPAVVVFLCVAMFGMAALMLHGVSSDPQSQQSASVTAISAQGFQGLRRLLDARGFTTLSNRFEDGPNVERGDLEVVTLDVTPVSMFMTGQADASSASDDDSSGASASEEAVEPEDVMNAHRETVMDAGKTKARSDHLLYHPLGRAVLVVAPKWQAGYYPAKPRWAGNASLISEQDLRDALTVLTATREVPTKTNTDGEYVVPKDLEQGEDWEPGQYKTTIFKRLPYVINHGDSPAKAVTLTGPDGRTVAAGKIANLQSISGGNLTPVLTGSHGEVLLARVEATGDKPLAAPIYLLSDPDLLNNQILGDPQRVIAALGIIDRVMPAGRTAVKAAKNTPTGVGQGKVKPNGQSIIFNLTFNGMTFDHDLLHALSRPPYVGIPVSVLILGIGLMWGAFARFGPARQAGIEAPLGRGVGVLADNAARLMSLTLRETRLAPVYATLMRDMVLKSRGYMQASPNASPNTSLDDVADRIGTVCKTTHSFAALRLEAAQAATVHHMVEVARKLHTWKTEISRAHI